MKLKTILPVVAVAGVLMCEPAVLLHAGTSDFASPEAMGWFRKKKKSETKDSVQSKSDYEKLTGSDAIARKGMFNVYQKKSDYYFEVPARLLGRDMLVVNKLQRVPSELNEAGVNRVRITKIRWCVLNWTRLPTSCWYVRAVLFHWRRMRMPYGSPYWIIIFLR